MSHLLSVPCQSELNIIKGGEKMKKMLLKSEMLAARRRLQSEQVNTVVICTGIMGAAEFNATQNTLTCLGMLKGTSGSERGKR